MMNKYQVLRVVGEGAYGIVLQCRHKESGDVVAIKKFKEGDEKESVRKTTLREVKILRMMNHPNIVSLIEAFRRKSKLYLVFEFVDRNLLEVLEENPSGLDFDLARSFCFQLIQAISWCHRKGVIHRDVKPENLLVSKKNELKLCDFGFARVHKEGALLTDYVATRWYRAPELLLGSTLYTNAVDMWAVGCIMGELVDGQPLFPGESEIDQLYIIQNILGPLSDSQMQMFLLNRRFLGLKFPDMSNPETLQKRYMGVLTKRGLAFMKHCLVLAPEDRLPSSEACTHPLFEDLVEKYAASYSYSSSNISDMTGEKGHKNTTLAPADRSRAPEATVPLSEAASLPQHIVDKLDRAYRNDLSKRNNNRNNNDTLGNRGRGGRGNSKFQHRWPTLGADENAIVEARDRRTQKEDLGDESRELRQHRRRNDSSYQVLHSDVSGFRGKNRQTLNGISSSVARSKTKSNECPYRGGTDHHRQLGKSHRSGGVGSKSRRKRDSCGADIMQKGTHHSSSKQTGRHGNERLQLFPECRLGKGMESLGRMRKEASQRSLECAMGDSDACCDTSMKESWYSTRSQLRGMTRMQFKMESERERQRESEIRSFREFSTQLPLRFDQGGSSRSVGLEPLGAAAASSIARGRGEGRSNVIEGEPRWGDVGGVGSDRKSLPHIEIF